MHSPWRYRAPKQFPATSGQAAEAERCPRFRRRGPPESPRNQEPLEKNQDEKKACLPRAPAAESRFSSRSVETLEKLKNLENEVHKLESHFDNIEAHATRSLSTEEKNRILALCRQLNGQLDKLQFNEIDAVVTTDLNSGKSLAKANRKALNATIDKLRPRVLAVHDKLLNT